MYDPFDRGPFSVSVRSMSAEDKTRNRGFPIEIWYPASQGKYPLVLYSHHSGGSRRSATYLCTHLSSHGYVVAALDHSEVTAPELKHKEGESKEERTKLVKAAVASRVPDICFLLDQMLKTWDSEASIDPDAIGIVGHSFGGWTVLATPEVEPRIKAVVALAPAGASNPRPGIIRATLTFQWGRDVPTLYLVAENDVPLPLDGMYELFERTAATKQMVILRRADHLHFIEEVETQHEVFRNMPLTGAEWDWMIKEIRPISELISGKDAHLFVRGLTLSHMDAILKRHSEAQRYLAGDIKGELAKRGVAVIMHEGRMAGRG